MCTKAGDFHGLTCADSLVLVRALALALALATSEHPLAHARLRVLRALPRVLGSN